MHQLVAKCSLILLTAACHPAKANTALFLLNVSLSSADVQTTFSEKPQPGYTLYETDPITRPLVSSLSKRSNFSLAIGGDLLLADIGLRMRHSPRWYRHVWWLPQLAVASGNIWGVTDNLKLPHAR